MRYGAHVQVPLCLYPMIVMLRLFKSFAAQPRLAVVTATLTTAGQDMVHFFIVFTSVYICMAVNGVLLFGQDLEDFSTFDRSFHTCFRAMFGDWDWDAMQEVGRILAGIWFWIFMLVMVVILLNMLLAILMDAYGEVKQHAGNAVTLQRQISEMIRRRKMFKRGERVRLNDIWDCFFKEIGDEKEMLDPKNPRKITPKFLLEHVPHIPLSQAKRTLKNSMETHEKKLHEPYTLDHAKEQIEKIDERTRLIRDEVLFTKEKIEYYDTMEVDHEHEHDHPPAHPETPRASQVSVEGEILNTVSKAVGQLSSELASVLAQEMQLMEKRQQHLEERQDEMQSTIKDMFHTLQHFQRQASEVVQCLERQKQRRIHVAKQREEREKAEAEKKSLICGTGCNVGGMGAAGGNKYEKRSRAKNNMASEI